MGLDVEGLRWEGGNGWVIRGVEMEGDGGDGGGDEKGDVEIRGGVEMGRGEGVEMETRGVR